MKSRISTLSRFALGMLAIALAWNGATATAQEQNNSMSVKVPIVMEEATVRGKVAVLESAREVRRVISGLEVNVWSTKEVQEDSNRRWKRKSDTKALERDKLLHETTTDDLGLFDLPTLDAGEYLLDVSEVKFRLSVIPQSAERAGQSEPKILLILIPKEVVSLRPKNVDSSEPAATQP